MKACISHPECYISAHSSPPEGNSAITDYQVMTEHLLSPLTAMQLSVFQ